jgi:hypothetical protein
VVAHLLKQESGERVADSGEVRLNADVRGGERLAILPDHDQHHGTTDIILRTADTIMEMARRNKVMEAEARKAIEAQKAKADAAQQRAAELQAHADSLEMRMDEIAAEFQRYVLDLQGRLASCRAELELRTREAELSREWLIYLSSEIMNRLGDAPAKLAELARETRAGLLEVDPASRPAILENGSPITKGPVQVSYDHDERIKSAEQQSVTRANRVRRRYSAKRMTGHVL